MEQTTRAVSGRAGWAARAALAWSLALGMSGCGGGGGDGPAAPAASVTVNAPSVSALNAEVLQGTTLPAVTLSGTVSGDVAGLAGRSVYVVVEDPASMFEANALLQLQQAGAVWQYTLSLTGRTLDTSGRRTGNLRVFVCLDAACTSRLNGTPISIPFDVNVVPGMTLGTHALQFTVPFGTVPAEQTVDVALSSFSTTWVSSDDKPYDPSTTKTLVLLNGNQANTGTQLRFRLTPAIPGTYTERIRVHTEAILGTNLSRDVNEYIDITYTVTPNDAVDHVFDPPALNLTHSASNPLLQEHGYRLYTNFGYIQSWVGVVFDPPPVANPTGPYNSWWDDYMRYSYACVGIGGGSSTVYDCLKPGVYTARVQYRITGSSSSRIVELPITMTVTP
jgi:hypothetical protein